MRTSVLVPSLTAPGRHYEVVQQSGAMYCDCPRFAFTRDPATDKHVALVAKADKLLALCAEAHGLSDPPRLCRQCLVTVLAIAARKVRRDYVTKAESKAKIVAARKKRSRKKKPATKEATDVG